MWITFDCFGTLVDWHTGFSNILATVAARQTPELVRAYHEFEREMEREKPFHRYRDVLVQSLLKAAKKIGLDLSESQARALPDSWNTMPLFADTEPMLNALRAMNCRLAVLTNCDNDLFAQAHRNFSKPFDLVITSERVRDYKPSLSHFRCFAELSGAAKSEWIHVACSFYHDIEPARRFDVRGIWLDRDRTGENPRIAASHVGSGPEVIAAIRQWRG